MLIMRIRRRCRRLVLAGVLAVMVSSCGPIPTGIAPPTASPARASLTALAVVVRAMRGQESLDVPKGASVDVQQDDRIEVQDEGRGQITFSDDLQIELLQGTDVLITGASLEPDGSVHASIRQNFGHSRTYVDRLAKARVEVVTDYATITALVDDTEFVVCHGEALTCMTTLSGEAQVEANGKIVTVREGEATYILKGGKPQPALCADLVAEQAWLDEARTAKMTVPLGQLVKAWPQQPCGTAPLVVTEPTAALDLPAATDMARIEAGTYTVGHSADDDQHGTPQQIYLPEFWIDKHEVTNGQYRAFMAAAGHPAPLEALGADKQPVRGVTWEDAAAYCAWAGKRLPSEAEWEAAGRGPGEDPPLYPWGSNQGAGEDLPLDATYEVGTQQVNQSPLGVFDLAGNVWEWVGDPYAPVQEGYQVLRGGRYGLIRDMAYRQQARPDDQRLIAVAGLRCAADQVKGE